MTEAQITDKLEFVQLYIQGLERRGAIQPDPGRATLFATAFRDHFAQRRDRFVYSIPGPDGVPHYLTVELVESPA